MRKSINGLSLLVAGQLDLSPLSGALFCFCNKQRDLIKILYWDRNGFCLWQKRLEKDRFRWPEKVADVLTLQGRELSWLLDGLSVDQCQAHDRFGVSIAGVKKNGIFHPDSDLILVKSAGWP